MTPFGGLLVSKFAATEEVILTTMLLFAVGGLGYAIAGLVTFVQKVKFNLEAISTFTMQQSEAPTY